LLFIFTPGLAVGLLLRFPAHRWPDSVHHVQIFIMGKGDIKTKKGKRHIGSFGKHRPHKKKTATSKPASQKPAP
jgi:ribosomal small subunit protein bTHX